jgi:hypothetical protein
MREHDPALPPLWLPAAALAALTACHSAAVRAPPTHVTAPEHVTPPSGVSQPATRSPANPAYDWHVLLIVPFGSVLKDIPLTLHEVLLFRDEARGAGAADDAECYAPDSPAPRFIGSTPSEYLLCFKHDRLARVQASVRLSDPQPAGVFAAACEDWLRHAVPAPADAAASTESAQSTGAPDSGACEGSDGAVRFNARLDDEATLSIALDGPPET